MLLCSMSSQTFLGLTLALCADVRVFLPPTARLILLPTVNDLFALMIKATQVGVDCVQLSFLFEVIAFGMPELSCKVPLISLSDFRFTRAAV